MEMFYGESKTLTVKGRNGAPLASRQITLTALALPDDSHAQTLRTDAAGRVTFDLLTVRHFKFGNSREEGGVTGPVKRTDYRQYTFSADGYRPLTISLTQLENTETLTLDGG
jgi:hypothetical protein